MYCIKVKNIKKIVSIFKIMKPTLVVALRKLLDSAHPEGDAIEVHITVSHGKLGQFTCLRELYDVLSKHSWGKCRVHDCCMKGDKLIIYCK